METGKTKTVSKLKDYGFAIEEGLRYCAGQERIYLTVLESALTEGREKISVLHTCFQEQDWERYKIEVHGLKNVAQMIGATRLFEKVNSQNQAAKDECFAEILESHPDMMEEYERTLNQIEAAMQEL